MRRLPQTNQPGFASGSQKAGAHILNSGKILAPSREMTDARAKLSDLEGALPSALKFIDALGLNVKAKAKALFGDRARPSGSLRKSGSRGSGENRERCCRTGSGWREGKISVREFHDSMFESSSGGNRGVIEVGIPTPCGWVLQRS